MLYLYQQNKKDMNTIEKIRVELNDVEIENLFREIENQNPTPFISMTLCTDFTSMVKKCKEDGDINPFYKNLKKVQTKTYRLVTDYQKRVKNNLIKEGKNPDEFVVESPSGKSHISKSVLTDKLTGTKRYVMLEWFPEIKGQVEYYQGENQIDEMLFKKWKTDYKSSNDKQGLEREVTPITPLFDSILSFRVNGAEFLRRND